MADEMSERVAQAIDEAMGLTETIAEVGGPHESVVAAQMQRKLILGARAAITAMREPTEGMQAAGARVDVAVARTDEGKSRCLTPGLIWRAMSDAAVDTPA
jgi:hypothetical protein